MVDTRIHSWPFYDAEQIELVKNVLASGKVNYLTGNEGRSFEKEFASWAGVKYAVALANGTVALTAAYNSLGLKLGMKSLLLQEPLLLHLHQLYF